MVKFNRTLLLASISWAFLASAISRAESPKAAKPEDSKAAKSEDSKATAVKLTVAVLDFSATDPANPELGRQIGEAVAAGLSEKQGFTLVDRQTLRRTIKEQSLNLTGLVDSDKAVKIGKLVGARLLVTGSAFTLGKQLTITAKLISTETTRVDSMAVKGAADADLGDLVGKLTEKLAARIVERGPKLVGSDTVADPLVKFRQRFAGRKLPSVAVIITEEHHGAPAVTVVIDRPVVVVRAVDPPVETELKQALIAAGFAVQDVPQNDLAKFASQWQANDVNSWPRSLARVDLLITGESFSEFGARIGDLTSCSARAEINIIRRSDGRIIQADKATTRAADLSENIAAKGALEKAGKELAVRTLEFFDRTLPGARPKNADRGKL